MIPGPPLCWALTARAAGPGGMHVESLSTQAVCLRAAGGCPIRVPSRSDRKWIRNALGYRLVRTNPDESCV